ncbi:MAG TPA: spore cortex-lytic protein [Syntrophomonadaceae bacterium]|nr:spore cortex-lytic protein [Syntrophomonadaceae bacterium]
MDLRKPQYYLAAAVAVFLVLSCSAYLIWRQGEPEAAPSAYYSESVAEASPEGISDNMDLLSRVIHAEAGDEPYLGKVGVGAVLMNRMRSSTFPNSLSGVIFEPYAFESVSNGLIWQRTPSEESVRAAAEALNGFDPTYGALFFWNPSKPVAPWIWTRQIITQIGQHVFAI